MSYLSVEIYSFEWKLGKSFTKLKSLRFMIFLTENLFSFKGSGFEESDFIFIYKCKVFIVVPPILPELMNHLEYSKTR